MVCPCGVVVCSCCGEVLCVVCLRCVLFCVLVGQLFLFGGCGIIVWVLLGGALEPSGLWSWLVSGAQWSYKGCWSLVLKGLWSWWSLGLVS